MGHGAVYKSAQTIEMKHDEEHINGKTEKKVLFVDKKLHFTHFAVKIQHYCKAVLD